MLKGQNIGLRAIEKEDLEQLLAWRNKPEFRQYFRENKELSMANQLAWYEKLVLKDPNTNMFAIVELETNRLLGACGLCYIDWTNKLADFSIYIGADNLYIDDKFAVDTAKTLIDYAFNELNLHKVWAEIYDFDTAKKELFEKLDFKLEGHHKETYWLNNKWNDSLFWGLINK
jgi:RimJ/RimL family protein N-acetyltransferase